MVISNILATACPVGEHLIHVSNSNESFHNKSVYNFDNLLTQTMKYSVGILCKLFDVKYI